MHSFMFGSLGTTEILLIVLLIALLFGSKKIVGLAKSMGRFKGEYKKGQMEVKQELEEMKEE